MEDAAAAELLLEELWREVMVIEDQPRSPPGGTACGEEQEVRWVRGDHQVRRPHALDAARDRAQAAQAHQVLTQERRRARSLRWRREAQHAHTVDLLLLLRCGCIEAGRGDRDLVPV